MSVKAVVAAIVDLSASLSGKNSNNVEKVMKTLKELLLPEYSENTKDKAEVTAEIMKRELAAGPMKVQALSYETRRKKKR